MQKVLYILGQLNDEDVDWLIYNGRIQEYPVGSILIEEGFPAEAVYIILEGTCSVTSRASHNREITQHGSGEVIGEMSFVDTRPPSATVKVVERAVVLSIPRQELHLKLERDTGFAARFYKAMSIFLSYRLRATVAQIDDLRDASAKATAELPRVENPDELDQHVLDNVSMAGLRFKRMLDQLVSH